MKKWIIVLSLLLFFGIIAAVENVVTPTPKKALLAMEKTKFKTALITEMKKKLEEESIEVTLVKDHKKELKNYKASDFDFVFITNSGVNSTVRPWILQWLIDNENSSNILLHTTKTKKWKENVLVDAVSSASDKKKATSLADTYIEELLKKKSSNAE